MDLEIRLRSDLDELQDSLLTFRETPNQSTDVPVSILPSSIDRESRVLHQEESGLSEVDCSEGLGVRGERSGDRERLVRRANSGNLREVQLLVGDERKCWLGLA